MISNTKLTRNIVKLMFVAVFLVGCARAETHPIEKYGGSIYVVSKIEGTDWGRLYNIQLKNKDTIFWATFLEFDAKSIKVGDTIR
jgi:hypothetical protein